MPEKITYYAIVDDLSSRDDPAGVLRRIVHDGGDYLNYAAASTVLDNLIAKKEIPVMIGIFVMHGRVKALSTNALDRFNRSYEYDGLGDNYARFLINELIPEVAARYDLSTNANDHAIAGARRPGRAFAMRGLIPRQIAAGGASMMPPIALARTDHRSTACETPAAARQARCSSFRDRIWRRPPLDHAPPRRPGERARAAGGLFRFDAAAADRQFEHHDGLRHSDRNRGRGHAPARGLGRLFCCQDRGRIPLTNLSRRGTSSAWNRIRAR